MLIMAKKASTLEESVGIIAMELGLEEIVISNSYTETIPLIYEIIK